MSHVDAGPLANYNSLLDPHLSGYFSNTRIKKHLKKSGLVTRQGSVVTENEFRVGMARKEHRRQVRDMLASAIVQKTLDLERQRQAMIRRKLEEIANIELVKRVKAHRKFGYEAAIEDMVKLNAYDAADEQTAGKPMPAHEPAVLPQLDSVRWSQQKPKRPQSGPSPAATPMVLGSNKHEAIRIPRPQSGPTGVGHRFEHDSDVGDEDDDETEHLWSRKAAWSARQGKVKSADKAKISTKLVLDQQSWASDSVLSPLSLRAGDHKAARPRSGPEHRISSKDLDYRHLSRLDRVATEKYGQLFDEEQPGRHESPYIENAELLVPHPPAQRRRDSAASSVRGAPKSTPRGGTNVPRDEHGRPIGCPKRSKGSLMLHRMEPAFKTQDQVQTFCTVVMRYFGSHIKLERDGVDPRQEVMVEQQHCGGSTLVVFKQLLLPNGDFSFTSRRHSGYPFSLTFYINGIQDIRLSACCEYKHRKGYRLGGKTGHFGFVRITGSVPCYRCQVELDTLAAKKQALARKQQRQQHQEQQQQQQQSQVSDAAPPPGMADEQASQPAKEDIEPAGEDYNDDFEEEEGKLEDTATEQQPQNLTEGYADDSHDKDLESESDADGIVTYGDDFDDDIQKEHNNKKEHTLKIALPDDSDEEARLKSKDKYQPPKAIKALNIPMPSGSDEPPEEKALQVLSSNWYLVMSTETQLNLKPDQPVSQEPPASEAGESHLERQEAQIYGQRTESRQAGNLPHDSTSADTSPAAEIHQDASRQRHYDGTSGNSADELPADDVFADEKELDGMTDSSSSIESQPSRHMDRASKATLNSIEHAAASTISDEDEKATSRKEVRKLEGQSNAESEAAEEIEEEGLSLGRPNQSNMSSQNAESEARVTLDSKEYSLTASATKQTADREAELIMPANVNSPPDEAVHSITGVAESAGHVIRHEDDSRLVEPTGTFAQPKESEEEAVPDNDKSERREESSIQSAERTTRDGSTNHADAEKGNALVEAAETAREGRDGNVAEDTVSGSLIGGTATDSDSDGSDDSTLTSAFSETADSGSEAENADDADGDSGR